MLSFPLGNVDKQHPRIHILNPGLRGKQLRRLEIRPEASKLTMSGDCCVDDGADGSLAGQLAGQIWLSSGQGVRIQVQEGLRIELPRGKQGAPMMRTGQILSYPVLPSLGDQVIPEILNT